MESVLCIKICCDFTLVVFYSEKCKQLIKMAKTNSNMGTRVFSANELEVSVTLNMALNPLMKLWITRLCMTRKTCGDTYSSILLKVSVNSCIPWNSFGILEHCSTGGKEANVNMFIKHRMSSICKIKWLDKFGCMVGFTQVIHGN